MNKYLGIDIGGSSIKLGIVRVDTKIEVEYFEQFDMPPKQDPAMYVDVVRKAEQSLEFDHVGIGFPSVIENGVVSNKPKNINPCWCGKDLCELFCFHEKETTVLNDADAAGIAEIHRPEAQELRQGTTIVLTLGTGIGSAIFVNSHLIPNSEIGMIELNGDISENLVAPSIMNRDNLTLNSWTERMNDYLAKIELYLSPNTIVLGGGISEKFEQYISLLKTKAVIKPAHYRNKAGVIGASVYASFFNKGA